MRSNKLDFKQYIKRRIMSELHKQDEEALQRMGGKCLSEIMDEMHRTRIELEEKFNELEPMMKQINDKFSEIVDLLTVRWKEKK